MSTLGIIKLAFACFALGWVAHTIYIRRALREIRKTAEQAKAIVEGARRR